MPSQATMISKKFRFKDHCESFAFILPAVIIFTIFYIIPFVQTFIISMQNWNGIDLNREMVWFRNFFELKDDKIWWDSFRHAGYITFIALTFQNALAFALALACDREIRMQRFYRVVFFLPPILSEVVVGLIWRWILEAGMYNGQHVGLLNYFLNKIGFHNLIHHWLSDPQTALTCIAVVHSWKGFGWGFIILLAGLQMIDRQLYEAAKVDGAGSWNVLKNVTIPMMIPVFISVAILTILGSMQVFVLIISLLGNGLADHTNVPVTRIFSAMTETNQFGYACAQGITFGIILAIISLTFKRISARLNQA